MHDDDFFFPQQVRIGGALFKAQRNKKGLLVPIEDSNNAPQVAIGDTVTMIQSTGDLDLIVNDIATQPSLGVGGDELMRLGVAPARSATTPPSATTVNIHQVNSDQVQFGDGNTQVFQNVHIQQLVEAVAKSGDDEAKSKLRQLLENSTVAGVIGAGITGLLALLSSILSTTMPRLLVMHRNHRVRIGAAIFAASYDTDSLAVIIHDAVETPKVGIGDIVVCLQSTGDLELVIQNITVELASSITHVREILHCATRPRHALDKTTKTTVVNHIENLNSQQTQIGNNNNAQTQSITMRQFVKALAMSGDEEAKIRLRTTCEPYGCVA